MEMELGTHTGTDFTTARADVLDFVMQLEQLEQETVM